ncbi:hypothetical protein ACVWWN_005443 [Mycobacterium sp. URHB0021]
MLALRTYHDSGSTTAIRSPLGILAEILAQRGNLESGATIAGFAAQPP